MEGSQNLGNYRIFLIDKQFFQSNSIRRIHVNDEVPESMQLLPCQKTNGGIRYERGKNHSIRSWGNGFFNGEELGYKEPFPRHQVEGKGQFVAKLQDVNSIIDSLVFSKFLQIGHITPPHHLECYKLVTGRDISMTEFLQLGERIFNLNQMFNVRCGVSRKDDTLPPRILTHKRRGEGLVVNMPHLGALLSDYYEYWDWSEDGIPTREKPKELGLIIKPGDCTNN